MTGKQVFWSCALTGYIVFLVAMINSGDGINGFCLALISSVIAGIAGVMYGIVRLVKWYSGGSRAAARPAKPAPVGNVYKELRKMKKHSDANMAALLQYIYDAVRDGSEGEAIRDSLLKKGWSENQVRAAFSSYQDMLARYPRPEKDLIA
jgi:hypothetical protein